MRLRAEGVLLQGVDWKDQPQAGYQWLQDRGDPYVRIGSDVTGRMGIDMGVSAVPETFVIDKQGRVRYRHVGAVTPQLWDETLRPLMDKLRSES
jgi:cytochrome c biogenesis protein CcmG/thiol:disulfide interchange protein DsbE